MWLSFLAATGVGYLWGSFPTGVVVARSRGVDLRSQGSGNIGATNAFRVLGKKWGATVLLVDLLKGTLGCLCGAAVAMALAGDSLSQEQAMWFRMLGALGSVLGHNFPIWLRFKGGKGIATSAGALAALTPWAFVSALGTWLLVFRWRRIVSLASITAAVGLPFFTWWTGAHGALIVLNAVLGLLAVWRHKANIVRLRAGTEPRIGGGGSPKEPTSNGPSAK